MQDNVIGKYIGSNSFINKLNVTLKLLLFIIMIISTFFINSIEDVIMLFSYLLLIIISSELNIKMYIKEILVFRIFIIFIILINILTLSTIEVLLVDLFRFIFIISFLLIFNHTTTINEIMYGIGRILDPFSIKKDDVVILYTTLIIKFPSIYSEEYYKISKIYMNRRLGKESISKRILNYLQIIKKSFNSAISRLNSITIDMKLRLFGYGKTRTNYRLNKISTMGVLIFILNILVLLVVIIY